MNKKSEACQVCIQKSRYDTVDISALLKPLGGMSSFVKKGDTVLLKVNLLNASIPEKAVCTHPEIVKAVAEEVLSVGGVPFIADSPGGPFTKRKLEKIYQKSGMATVASEFGIKLNYDTSSKKVDISNGKRLKKTSLCNFYLTADKTISLPKLKTHSLMLLTLAMKNMYGVVPGLLKAKYHSTHMKTEYFAAMLVDLFSVTRTDLVVLDGIVGMQGDGPGNGDPVELGIVFASDNAVGLDISVCNMLGVEPVSVPVLKQANIQKMWPDEILYPLLRPLDVCFSGFELPDTARFLFNNKKDAKLYPFVNERCIGCGECKQICPRDAITILDGVAIIQYDKCIQCYCCHEICPVEGMTLQMKPKCL
jgi:uncharacterized protein (DUF362 family)/NAD-dependent dihydropyrimidine dehydrogenase PreA subunit